MAKTSIPVDKDLLQQAIETAESKETFPNQSKLWAKVAEIYNQNDGVKSISGSVVYLRVNQFGLSCKTEKGRKRRGPMSEEQKAKMQEARKNASRMSKADKLKTIPKYEENIIRLREVTPTSLHSLIEKMANGSRVAAEKLQCLQCTGFDRSSVRECSSMSCPLFLYRPYQSATEEDETEEDAIEASE